MLKKLNVTCNRYYLHLKIRGKWRGRKGIRVEGHGRSSDISNSLILNPFVEPLSEDASKETVIPIYEDMEEWGGRG